MIIANVTHVDKDSSEDMTNHSGKDVIDLTPPREIITTSDQDYKILTDALLVQQKMTKLLIHELKQDQENVVEKVKNEIQDDPRLGLIMVRLETQNEEFKTQLKSLTGN